MSTKKENIELRKKVVEELEFDPGIDASAIGVGVEDGIVSLTGHVTSYAEKTAAEQIVKRVQGVEGVANDVEVKLRSSLDRDDADVARAAVHRLEWHVSIPKDHVQVIVKEGWVTLEGTVDWHYQKRAAEDAVFVLAGVRGITNNILVTGVHARPRDVKQKIEAALERNAAIDAEKIAISCDEGTVILSGTVRSWAERQDAVNAAWSAPGVTEVVDHIHIAA